MKNNPLKFGRLVQMALPAFFLLLSFYSVAQDRVTGRTFATRSEVIGQHGMVASGQPLATQIGLDILKKGGSAVDAAIAVNAALGLMEPTGSGVGGDLFAIVYEAKTGKLYGLNASGRSPQSLTIDYFKEKGLKTIPALGPLPVNVPGCVDGWIELNKWFRYVMLLTKRFINNSFNPFIPDDIETAQVFFVIINNLFVNFEGLHIVKLDYQKEVMKLGNFS